MFFLCYFRIYCQTASLFVCLRRIFSTRVWILDRSLLQLTVSVWNRPQVILNFAQSYITSIQVISFNRSLQYQFCTSWSNCEIVSWSQASASRMCCDCLKNDPDVRWTSSVNGQYAHRELNLWVHYNSHFNFWITIFESTPINHNIRTRVVEEKARRLELELACLVFSPIWSYFNNNNNN